MKTHKLNIAIIIFLVLSTADTFPQRLVNYLQFGLKCEYFNQDGYNGMNLNLAVIPKDEILGNIFFINDYQLLGINEDNFTKKIRMNFTLLNIKGFNIDSVYDFNMGFEYSIISIKHNIQIKSDISWLKICPGFGFGKKLGNNSVVFLGINGGLGLSSAYLGDNVNGFGNKDFDGVSILGSALFFYQIDFLKIKITNDFKTLFWTDKSLYSNKPNIEASLNLSQIFSKNFKNERQMYLNIGINNSILYFETERNQSFIFYVNIFSTFI
jgi:hypothetical protein